MRFHTIMLATVLLSATMQAIAGEAEVRKYCEDAAQLMKVQGTQRDAYVASCIEERTEQLKDEK